MRQLDNRWKLIFAASCVAFLLEYSLRGINNLLKHPGLVIPIFLNYFTYLTLMEEFIGRFKLKDYQVWIVAQFFTLLWQFVSVAGVYYPPFLFGINIGTLLINNLVWWTTIQTLFAFYIGRRLVPNIDRSKSLLNRFGIFIFFLSFLLLSASFRLFTTPPVTPWQFLVMLTLLVFFGILFYRTAIFNLRRETELAPFRPDKALDILAVLMVGFLVFSFIFLTGGNDAEYSAVLKLVNTRALIASLIISPLIALGLLLKRLVSGKPIPF